MPRKVSRCLARMASNFKKPGLSRELPTSLFFVRYVIFLFSSVLTVMTTARVTTLTQAKGDSYAPRKAHISTDSRHGISATKGELKAIRA